MNLWFTKLDEILNNENINTDNMSANELRALVNAEHPHGNPNFWDVT